MARLDKYTHGDHSMTMAEWSRFLKIPVSTLRDSYLKIGFRMTMQRFYKDQVKREPVKVKKDSPVIMFNRLNNGAQLSIDDVLSVDLMGFYKYRAGSKQGI